LWEVFHIRSPHHCPFAPGTVSFVFNKTAVIVLNGGPDLRRQLEQQIQTDTHNRVIAASSILGEGDMRSIEAFKSKLLAEKFDGVIVLRMVRATEVNDAATVPGESFTNYANSVGQDEPAFGGNHRVDARVFNVADEKLIWRATLDAHSSLDAPSMVSEIVKVLRDTLRDTGLVHD